MISLFDLLGAMDQAERYATALIAIAARFTQPTPCRGGTARCWYCDEPVECGCDEGCPGLLARRALGVG